MLDFYGPLLLVICLIIIQATFVEKGKLGYALTLAVVFTLCIIFLLHNSYWLFLFLLINFFQYNLACVCYFTRPRFKSF